VFDNYAEKGLSGNIIHVEHHFLWSGPSICEDKMILWILSIMDTCAEKYVFVWVCVCVCVLTVVVHDKSMKG
jgi:hypothetical protein